MTEQGTSYASTGCRDSNNGYSCEWSGQYGLPITHAEPPCQETGVTDLCCTQCLKNTTLLTIVQSSTNINKSGAICYNLLIQPPQRRLV